jgi:hypothetical protein
MNAAVPSCTPSFSPSGHWGQVPPAAVQAALRDSLARWGRPERFRLDNGMPWGSWSDLPTDLALWLIGLGIEMIWNDPRRPQQNGVIERSQGTGKRWTEPRCCHSPQELQQHFTDMDRLQREEYPYQQQRTRWQVYPTLRHSGRTYSRSWEARQWSLRRAQAHLAGYAVTRRVDRTGQISLYDHNAYVGVLHKGKTVWVLYDPEEGAWVIRDENHNQLRIQLAKEITAERIRSLTVSVHRHGKPGRRGAAKLSCRD